jgi:hypothetical protein
VNVATLQPPAGAGNVVTVFVPGAAVNPTALGPLTITIPDPPVPPVLGPVGGPPAPPPPPPVLTVPEVALAPVDPAPPPPDPPDPCSSSTIC